MTQQMLAHFRPYRFSAMYDMSYSTKSVVAIGEIQRQGELEIVRSLLRYRGCGGRQVYQAASGNIRRGRDGGRVHQTVGTTAGERGGRLGGGELRSRA